MDDTGKLDAADLMTFTAEIVAAYVGHNNVRASEMPEIIASVHATLVKLGEPAVEQPKVDAPVPAVPIKKSITDDYIVSLEDGRKFKSMKRYLAGLGMTPDQYRQKWGLPRDYPMVAPAYAAKRSELAKAVGLGRKAGPERVPEAVEVAPPTAPEAVPEPVADAKPKRGRTRKAKEAEAA